MEMITIEMELLILTFLIIFNLFLMTMYKFFRNKMNIKQFCISILTITFIWMFTLGYSVYLLIKIKFT